jgi:four helix bundle protein
LKIVYAGEFVVRPTEFGNVEARLFCAACGGGSRIPDEVRGGDGARAGFCQFGAAVASRELMQSQKSQADQLEERFIEFASKIIQFSTELPKTPAGCHMAMQILRSGTSGAPNYAEARGAESSADFIHKLKVVQKELNETAVWLRILSKSVAIKDEIIVDILQENLELARIITASICTAKTRSMPAPK